VSGGFVCRLCGCDGGVERHDPVLGDLRFAVPEGWRLFTVSSDTGPRVICARCNTLIVNAGAVELVSKLRAEFAQVQVERDVLLAALEIAEILCATELAPAAAKVRAAIEQARSGEASRVA
jgi:hypothetical protein